MSVFLIISCQSLHFINDFTTFRFRCLEQTMIILGANVAVKGTDAPVFGRCFSQIPITFILIFYTHKTLIVHP